MATACGALRGCSSFCRRAACSTANSWCDAGRPLFYELLFGRGRPTYVAFDPLIVDGVDLRPLPLKERKAALARVGKGADRWIALTNGIVGDGRALYRAVADADLED